MTPFHAFLLGGAVVIATEAILVTGIIIGHKIAIKIQAL